MTHEEAPETVVQFYLPPKEDTDPVLWFDADSDDDLSDGFEPDFTTRLLGAGEPTKDAVDSKSTNLTAPIVFAAMIPGFFVYFISVGCVALGLPVAAAVGSALFLTILSVGAIVKLCYRKKWYWARLAVICVMTLAVCCGFGIAAGGKYLALRHVLKMKIYEGVNPSNAPVGNNGVYHFSFNSTVNALDISPYTIRDQPGYDIANQLSCFAPIQNTRLVAGISISYFAIQFGSCCATHTSECWPGTDSSKWVGEYFAPASASNGITAFATRAKIVVPVNSVVVKVLDVDYKTTLIQNLAIYASAPLVLTGLLMVLLCGVGCKKPAIETLEEKHYNKLADE